MGLTAPDPVSAQLMAASIGESVEDLSQRDATTQVFAQPDGTWRGEAYSGPEWVKVDGDGTEEDDRSRVDTTLHVNAAGDVVPVASPAAVTLASGGEPTDVIMTTGFDGSETEVELMWDGSHLPPVELDGPRAIYSDISPGVDYIVEVVPSGFRQYYVLHDADAAAGFDGLHMDLRTNDGSLEVESDGSFAVVDEDGAEVAFAQVAAAWDASEDRKQSNPVLEQWNDDINLSPGTRFLPGLLPDATVDSLERATEGHELPEEEEIDVSATVKGDVTRVALGVSEEWLADEATEYPVVVDPSLNTSADRFVRSNYPTKSFNSGTELFVGTFDSGTSRYRSYINFNTSSIKNLDLVSAKLYLWNHHSWSCNSRQWKVHMATSTSSSTTWNNPPTVYSTFAAATTSTKGYSSSCGDGWVTANITDMVNEWTKTSTTTHAVRLSAGSETDNFYWKRFYSRDHSTSTRRPKIVYTYNSPPTQPITLQVDGKSVANNGVLTATSATPKISIKVEDPNGGSVRAYFKIYKAGQTSYVTTGYGGYVQSGQRSVWTPSYAFEQGEQYVIDAWAHDGRLFSNPRPGTWAFEPRNLAPSTPSSFRVGNATPPSSGTVTITNPTPSLSVVVNDSDSTNVRALYSVYRGDELIVDKHPGTLVTPGNRSTLSLPFPLQYGEKYTFKVWAFDEFRNSASALAPGATFTLQLAPPDEVPTVCDQSVGAVGNADFECEAN
jgi:hypothetical protein